MFAVVDKVAWRRVLDTTGNGTPAVIDNVAVKCRRSCTVVRGTPLTPPWIPIDGAGMPLRSQSDHQHHETGRDQHGLLDVAQGEVSRAYAVAGQLWVCCLVLAG
jgi:hypothetical protein